jgi:hypothetical protein
VEPLCEEEEANCSDTDAAVARVEEEEAARLGEETEEMQQPVLSCVYRFPRDGLGLVFQSDGANALRVAACTRTLTGALSSTVQPTGDPIEPGDTVLRVNGKSERLESLLVDGQLNVGEASTVELHFTRQPRGQSADLGGAPSALVAKHNWTARKKGRQAAATSNGGLGGSPAGLAKKPQPTRASRQPARPPPRRAVVCAQPVVGDVSRVTSACTGVVEAQAEALRARLMGVQQLSREQQIERDAELSTATYIS